MQVRPAEDKPWQKAAAGMELGEGWEIRTGLRSICQFTIKDTHVITLDRLGTVTVLNAVKQDGMVKTDVGMKYGRTQYQVDAVGEQHESRIHAPAATLAVRGSIISMSDDPAYGTTAIVSESQSAVYSQRGVDQVNVVPIEMVRGVIEQRSEELGSQPGGPGEVALRESTPDPGGHFGRSGPLEQQLVGQFPGSDTLGNPNGAINPGEFRDQSLIDQQNESIGNVTQPFPGSLQVQFAWTGNADLDVALRDPLGGLTSTFPDSFAGSSTVTRPSGPATYFAGPDDIGGVGGGSEQIFSSSEILSGSHTAIARFSDFDGATAASVTITVVKDSQVIHSATGTVDAVNPVFSTNFAVPPPPPPPPPSGP